MNVNMYNQKNLQSEETCSAKLCTFIKTKPIIFASIILGILVVIALIIII